ncbi:unnamed protein product [Paramecium octaurelia]|uniref:Uncharacterized protein n=1 Tax=Paramecium octaurelia TaxID=43137 RepID=A0A8S1TQ59_PAROT|nr:unnamed protein product [Paramecium octaurelia]
MQLFNKFLNPLFKINQFNIQSLFSYFEQTPKSFTIIMTVSHYNLVSHSFPLFMVIIQIYLLDTLVLGIPNVHQRKVIEELKREDKLFDFHPNEKLNNKMKIGPYPQDQVDCNQASICKDCKSNEAYLITPKNVHLIGLHFGYKQEIIDLFHSLKFIDQDSALWFAFSEKQICIEKSQLQIDISLKSIFNQYQTLQNTLEVFPQLFSIQDNIKLNNIRMMARFDRDNRDDWNYEILSLNYTGNCDSDLLLCEQFYQEPTNVYLRVNGKLKAMEDMGFEIIGNKNIKQIIIEEMILPNLIFDQLIKQFFGERFIEQIEYDMDRQYKVEVKESLKEHKLELELIIEEH